MNHAQSIMEKDYSIHFHVWGPSEILELINTIIESNLLPYLFELEFFLSNKFEISLILRKKEGRIPNEKFKEMYKNMKHS